MSDSGGKAYGGKWKTERNIGGWKDQTGYNCSAFQRSQHMKKQHHKYRDVCSDQASFSRHGQTTNETPAQQDKFNWSQSRIWKPNAVFIWVPIPSVHINNEHKLRERNREEKKQEWGEKRGERGLRATSAPVKEICNLICLAEHFSQYMQGIYIQGLNNISKLNMWAYVAWVSCIWSRCSNHKRGGSPITVSQPLPPHYIIRPLKWQNFLFVCILSSRCHC